MSNIKMSESEQKKKIRSTWQEYSKTAITIDLPNHDTSIIYAYGSEIACLRLYKRFNSVKNINKIDVKYSGNLDSWYFRLEND